MPNQPMYLSSLGAPLRAITQLVEFDDNTCLVRIDTYDRDTGKRTSSAQWRAPAGDPRTERALSGYPYRASGPIMLACSPDARWCIAIECHADESFDLRVYDSQPNDQGVTEAGRTNAHSAEDLLDRFAALLNARGHRIAMPTIIAE